MKARLLFYISCLLLLSECLKLPDQAPATMKALVAPDNFDWSVSKPVTIHLSNLPAGVIRISSADESELYMKAMDDGISKEMDLSISLPAYIQQLRINEQLLSINSGSINYSLKTGSYKSININTSLNLNGTNSWVKVAGGATLAFTNKYSMSAWVKASRQQTAKIVQKGDWDGLGLGQDLWNGWQTSVAFSDGTSAVLNWGGGRPVLNQWYHLVGTYDGTILKIYVDGVLKNSVAESKNIRANGRFVSIGSDAGSQKFFQGLLDEVSIWNEAMSINQITTARTIGLTGGESGLKAYWKFNEGSGNTSLDQTISHLDGTNNSISYSTEVGYAQTVDMDGDGVPDSYDDYPLDSQRAFNNYFPVSGYGTLAFEDLWPSKGDFDFNDLVVGYLFNTITNSQNKLVETKANFLVRAIGGSFKNGFGVQLRGTTIPSSEITCSGYNLQEKYITLLPNGLEAQQAKPTFIVFDNAFRILSGNSGTFGVNVQSGETFIPSDTVKIRLNYPINKYTLTQLDQTEINPFLIVNKDRSKEIHLADQPPTSLADISYFGTVNDNSIPSANRYYKSKNNLPWALNIPGNFDYPLEKQDILTAHLKMSSWVQSGGSEYADWYMNQPGYRNQAFLYHH
ncbi:MAG: LruC domain-containing protein [Bacteroidetes bacterium]|nr:LruC domain-containing protein [Bacteroidota bacterium]